MTTRFGRLAATTMAAAAVIGAGVAPAGAAPRSSISMTIQDGSEVVQMPVHSFSWGASNPTTIGAGGGSGSSKASFSAFNLMREADAYSPQLYRLLATGRPLEGADVEFASGAFSSWYCMDEVRVESAQQSASTGSTRPTESVSLAYEVLTVKVGMSSFTWDLTGAEAPDAGSSPC